MLPVNSVNNVLLLSFQRHASGINLQNCRHVEVGKKPPAAGPATSVPSTLRGKFSKKIPNIYQNIYQDISKSIQDMSRYSKIYKIPSGGGAAPPGPAPRRRPRRRVVFCISWYIFVYLGYIWIYLGIYFGEFSPKCRRYTSCRAGCWRFFAHLHVVRILQET